MPEAVQHWLARPVAQDDLAIADPSHRAPSYSLPPLAARAQTTAVPSAAELTCCSHHLVCSRLRMLQPPHHSASRVSGFPGNFKNQPTPQRFLPLTHYGFKHDTINTPPPPHGMLHRDRRSLVRVEDREAQLVTNCCCATNARVQHVVGEMGHAGSRPRCAQRNKMCFA
jgi:hypothetical protein